MRNKILPFWHDKVDFKRGGYTVEQGDITFSVPMWRFAVLSVGLFIWFMILNCLVRPLKSLNDFIVKHFPGSRHIIEQARLIWLFSTMMLKDFNHENHSNRQAADAGVNFLLSHFLDKKYGGYYWSTDEKGNVIDDHKFAYPQSFVICALSRYARATEDSRAKNAAMDLFRTFKLKSEKGATISSAWLEHFERDWTPITTGYGPLGPQDRMSGNFVVHLVESLIELYRATEDSDVSNVLQDVLDVHGPRFFPQNPLLATKTIDLQGNQIESGADDYGHLIQYAWLGIETDLSMGDSPNWEFFNQYMEYVVQGLNQKSGGVPTSTFLVWWPQCELLSAISLAKSSGRLRISEDVLMNFLNLVFWKFVDPSAGVMYRSLEFDGSIRDSTLASKWKVGYHEVRAILRFIEAFQSPQ